MMARLAPFYGMMARLAPFWDVARLAVSGTEQALGGSHATRSPTEEGTAQVLRPPSASPAHRA